MEGRLTDAPGIGQLNEKPLHAALKAWCAEPGDRFEVALDGFVIDIVRGDLLIEIQTGSFFAIKAKLTRLLQSRRVRLIYPIASEKWIARLGATRRHKTTRRKSPKRGRVEDVFHQLVSIPQLLTNPNLTIEAVLIHEEESRRFVAGRRWRRRGWTTEERRLLEVVERRVFASLADWRALLPPELNPFTAADLAAALKIPTDLAQKVAYVLRHASIVERIGSRDRAYLYALPAISHTSQNPSRSCI